MRALDIILDAYERCNRLSPGETLSADDSEFGLRRLNLLVDELSGQNIFMFLSVLTSAAQSGPITLGTGSWAAISPGDDVVSATANNLVLSPITMRQYNELYQPNVQGVPTVYATDGLSTVYLWPVPNGQTIKLQTRSSVSKFIDLTTDYTVPDGYQSALGAALAVRIAPSIIGSVPDYLRQSEKDLMGNISLYNPAILNVDSFTGTRAYFPPRLF
jgi:hypothetical protein